MADSKQPGTVDTTEMLERGKHKLEEECENTVGGNHSAIPDTIELQESGQQELKEECENAEIDNNIALPDISDSKELLQGSGQQKLKEGENAEGDNCSALPVTKDSIELQGSGQQNLKEEGENTEDDNHSALPYINDSIELQEGGQQKLEGEYEKIVSDKNSDLPDFDTIELQEIGQQNLEGECDNAVAVSDNRSAIPNIPDVKYTIDLQGNGQQKLEEESDYDSALQDFNDTPAGSSSMCGEAGGIKDSSEHDYSIYDSWKFEGGYYPCRCGCGSLATDCNLVSSGSINQDQMQPKMMSNDRFNTQMDRMLLVGNLSPDTENSDLIEYFATYGPIDRVYVKRDYSTHTSMKFAYVIFSSSFPIIKVLEVEHVINDSHIQVKKVRQDSGIIFVSNLGPNLTEYDIMCFYSEYGRVIDVHIVHTLRYKQNKRCCFVTFQSGDIAHKVIASRKTIINGKRVKLQAFEDVTGAPNWMSQMDGDIEKLHSIFQDWDSYEHDYSIYDRCDYTGGYYVCTCGCGYFAADCPNIY